MNESFSDVNLLSLPQAAAWYALNGYPVFPCTPGAKTPLVRWSQAATTDLVTIGVWWELWPEANIGLPLGRGTHAIDSDEKNGESGFLSLMEAGASIAPAQPVQHTPNGGTHLLFESNLTFSNFTRRGGFGGVDMRTDGGYILGAPSLLPAGAYWWEDGDPAAPLPDEVLASLADWSMTKAARPASSGGFELPAPTEMTDFEVDARILSLGPAHSEFLLNGVSDIGDRSRSAYRVCYAAFRTHGWTLADMARIGPETELAVYGGDAPHHASNPWAWFCRYTLRTAWEAAQADLERYKDLFEPLPTPPVPGLAWLLEPPEGSGSPAREDADNSSGGSGPVPVRGEVQDTFESLLAAATALQPRDVRALQAWVLRVKTLGLYPEEEEALWQEAKRFCELGVGVIRAAGARIEQTVREKKRQERAAEEGNRPVWVADQGKVLDRMSGNLITKDSFLTIAAREFDGKVDRAAEYYLLGRDAVAEVVESITYDPSMSEGVGVDARGVRVYNTYRPGTVTGSRDRPGMWLDLLDALRLEGGQASRDALLDRMAWTLQHPGRKFNHGILLGGAHGIGKDSLLAPFLDAVGRSNVNHVHGSELGSNFTSWLTNAKVVLVNEVDYGDHRDRKRISELLKPALAAPPETLRIDEKNIRPYSVPNRVQLFGMTNHRSALYMDQGERRWLALWCGNQISSDPDNLIRQDWDRWFVDYWSWLDHGGREAVTGYLMNRDVSHMNPGARPMETKWLKEMKNASLTNLEQWVMSGISEKQGVWSLPAVDLDVLMNALREDSMSLFGGKTPNIRSLEAVLNKMQIPQKTIDRGRGPLRIIGGKIWILDAGLDGAGQWQSGATTPLRAWKAKHGLFG